jgi:hypothetical protein
MGSKRWSLGLKQGKNKKEHITCLTSIVVIPKVAGTNIPIIITRSVKK